MINASNTVSGDNGFSRKLNAPSLVARTASLSPARPLIMMTGSSGSRSRNLARVANPSSAPGIIRSNNTASGTPSAAAATPEAPSGASRTSYPSPTSSAASIRRIFGSSSTISTDAISDSLHRLRVQGAPTQAA